MDHILTEGSKLYWEEESSQLPDCSASSHLAASKGELTNVTEGTREAVTGRKNNDHLFYRSMEEVKRRLEILREHKQVLTVDDIVAEHAQREREEALEGKLSSAADAGVLADMTAETRVAVTGRAFPDTVMYRSTEEARLRIKAGRIRASRSDAPPAEGEGEVELQEVGGAPAEEEDLR